MPGDGVGGGPAGALSAYFLLRFARVPNLELRVDIYEPRDFTRPGPHGCNMCGGLLSESLMQVLADEGIRLPPVVVQRAIDAYRSIARDNRYGKLIFLAVRRIRMSRLLLRGVLKVAAREQTGAGTAKRMSIVLWDMFTGSAPYREILLRSIDPRLLGRFLWEIALPAAWPGGPETDDKAKPAVR